jgi:hypothetical protein
VFVSLAHSPALETPPDAPSPLLADTLVRWTPHGISRLSGIDPDAQAIARALGRVRRVAAQERRDAVAASSSESGGSALGSLGSSERWAQVNGP